MRYGVLAGVLVFSLGMTASAVAAGDAKNGKTAFAPCSICHNAEKDAGNGMGPNLFGVAGRKAASLPDFSYSPALKAAGITWSDDKLTMWVSGPAKMVPGTKMIFAGIPVKKDADDVVAYLDSLK